MSSKKFTIVLGILLVLFLGYVGYKDAVRIKQDLQAKEQKIQQLDTQKVELNKKLDETTEIKEKTQVEVQKLEKEKQDLENERKRLEGELQAKIERKAEEERIARAESQKSKLAQAATRVINAVTFTATASAETLGGARSGCGDNEYAAYIYGQESGGRVSGNCDTGALNSNGCTGIGQSCPASKIAHCGLDYACQNAWFTNYAIERYGSWAAAYSFHKANGWW